MDETQRLVMQVVNADKIRDLTKDLEAEEATLEKLVAMLKQGAITFGMFEAAAAKPGARAVELTAQIKALEAQTRSYGQASLTAAHALQDFTQGGIGGVLNNIPMLVSQLGGPAGLAAAISVVGVAAYVASPLLKGFWKSFTDDGGSIPLGGLAEMSKRLEEVKKSVEGIKKADAWNLETIQKYNQLLESQASIEKDIAERKKHRSDYEAFMASSSDADKAASDDLRKGFQQEFAGEGKDLQGELMKGMEAAAEFERDRLRNEIAGTEVLLKQAQGRGDQAGAKRNADRVKALYDQLAKVGDDVNKQVVDMLAEAAGGTDPVKQRAALGRMQGIVGPGTSERISKVISGSPNDPRAAETAEERSKRLGEDRDAEGKKVDALNAAGREGEEAFRKDQDDKRKRDADEAKAASRAAAARPRSMDSLMEEAGALEMRGAGFAEGAEQEQMDGKMDGPASRALAATQEKYQKVMAQIVKNQRDMAARFNQMNGGLDRMQQDAETVPTLIDFGN